MNIIIDIGHPGHVHLFKNFANVMSSEGHNILFTARDKESIIDLLKIYDFNFKVIGRHRKFFLNKIMTLFSYNVKLLNIAKFFLPDLFLSHGSVYAAHASAILDKPHISLEDTEHSVEQITLYKPFTNLILTSTVFESNLGKKQIRYNSFNELAYLHRDHFSADSQVIQQLNLLPNEKFVIIRFVSWDATHDLGHRGLSLNDKLKLVKDISTLSKVFISSEGPLPLELEKYKISTPPHKLHDALYYSSLYIGEGATMASECAVLGTPSIYMNSLNLGYINSQKKHGIVFQTLSLEKALKISKKILTSANSKQYFSGIKENMLSDKINLADYLCEIVPSQVDI